VPKTSCAQIKGTYSSYIKKSVGTTETGTEAVSITKNVSATTQPGRAISGRRWVLNR
jgi:hypothetical protein